jgi:hypothetical protein
LRYAYETTGSDDTQRMLLLQNAAFVPLFRQAMISRNNNLNDLRIDQLEAAPLKVDTGDGLHEIFADVSNNRLSAAKKTLTYLSETHKPKELIDAARVLVFLKGRDSHDYKFSSAVLEDYYHVSPPWRDRYLASSMFYLRGSSGPDNELVKRTRAALKG